MTGAKRWATWLASLLFILGRAQLASTAERALAAAPAANGQAALSVGFDGAGQLCASSCRMAPCTLSGGTPLHIPGELAQRLKSSDVEVVQIGKQRHAVVVGVADASRQRKWYAVVAAPLGGGAPQVIFQGFTGFVEGEYGLRHGPMVQVSRAGRSAEGRILVGEQQEDISLCGRPTILAPRVLLADDLKLYPAKVQRLNAREREHAPRLLAVRVGAEKTVPEEPPLPDASLPGPGSPPPVPLPPGIHLLRATAASSAVGLPAALTDGDPATTWAENRGGAGKGEFVVMSAPDRVPLSAFEVIVRPPGMPPEGGVAPRDFWIVAGESVFLATMPEDAWEHPGARYRVSLPAPVSTDCVALVTESAFQEHKGARVTFAEFSAVPEIDTSNVGVLVGMLNGGGPRAEAAAAALSAMGPAAFNVVFGAYDKLDAEGRRLGLNVIDHAPCPVKVPLYVKALFGVNSGERIHARDRIRRCGAAAGDGLVEALRSSSARKVPLLAAELATLAPRRAVTEIAPRLTGSKGQRLLLRKALATALRLGAGQGVKDLVRQVLGDRGLPAKAAIDVLRALGPRVGTYEPDASRLLTRLSSSNPDFRTRYLLLEPASHLAARNPRARAFVSNCLTADPVAYVRTHAAQVVTQPELFSRELLSAAVDPEARVRQAAVQALTHSTASSAREVLLGRLSKDSWPFVREAAATALATVGPSASADEALAEALGDDSVQVKQAVIEALGQRGVRSQGPALRDLLDDKEEAIDVRIAAVKALGTLCDLEAVPVLAGFVRFLVDPLAERDNRSLGWAALKALGRLKPRDLRDTLRPLLAKEGVSDSVRRAARAALVSPGACHATR